jgi:ribosomal protein S18 acetylase RimI-like enzyme
MSNMKVRRLVPAEAPAYRELMLKAYAEHPDAFTSSHAERASLPLEWWQSRLGIVSEPRDVVLGAFADDRLAGVAGISFESREKARHKATLFGMYVLPAYRHKGCGRALVLAALAHARSRDGIMLVQLTVTDGNDSARLLYEDCGFVRFGLEPFAVAVGSTFVSKIHMWRKLDSIPQ